MVLSTVVVDDDEPVRRLLQVRLESTRRFSVVAHGSDGEEVEQLVSAYRPDVLIVDNDMPRKNGLDALRQMSVRPPGMTIVVYTSDCSDDVVRAASSAGAHEVVGKLRPFEELLEAVTAHRRSSRNP
jgi:DNA-binding NarL/FixJ family response regulator